ncbi:permease-like cell division protein FtsX [Acetobacterium wieringae]|uniref:Cell division protein FtsX n=2 Tax=Acetobacterium wieringae TaxID=52694 RepID=A0A1F2PFV4_9FIRM|nr:MULTISPECIES: permease-like cell division protein FtsX [Acetobacterium]OFV69965.1 cell division protein FtsX [Acetobacterium wieringae]TYC85897.1 ABC transporter permease [Acetobacterium wieringae]URN85354.1 permease-like cell division protein FtsX [Acetobacterium wieringae]UYO63782.1 permease-like cell division protein FtsX [Acetobacterium wieringae]VUZ27335.1 Cell division protein FtsX [Acetobacterium wieringae]
MKFSSIKTMPKNVVRDTLKSIERNNLMSAASVLSVIAALIILGIFLILTINVQEVTKDVESKLELKIFLQSDFTDTQKATIEQALEKSDLIEEVTFESAEEALEKFTVSLEDYAPLLSGYNSENNPMPASFVVRVTDPDDMDEVQTLAMSFEGQGVEYVRYGQEYVEALVSFNKFTNTLSIVVLVVLSMISIFIIYNTIKLTVFARRREIGIMKYVGATNAYIRAPFILEGTLLGLMGAIVAFLIIRITYYYILGLVGGNLFLPVDASLASPDAVMGQLIFFFLIYGGFIGAVGSVFAIRKFLDV